MFFQTFSFLLVIGSIPGVDRRGIIEPLILQIKAGREAEGIVRVVVVDCPVGVHIHEIVGVARIRRTEPPISGDTEYNLITRRIKLAPYRSV